MANPNPELIAAIENTVSKLKNGSPYQWGHMCSFRLKVGLVMLRF